MTPRQRALLHSPGVWSLCGPLLGLAVVTAVWNAYDRRGEFVDRAIRFIDILRD